MPCEAVPADNVLDWFISSFGQKEIQEQSNNELIIMYCIFIPYVFRIQVIAPGGHHQPQSRPSRSAAHDLHRLRNGEAFAIAQVLGTFGTETIGGFVMFCQV